ncbi:MAG: DUF1972 domain-containing protein [Cyclobacteriaceae bacterium]|nr:DUF1972 domain-containing protein [Cyclobacteriaceae bacterium]
MDGIEWKRNKWGEIAKYYLKFSEMLAVKYSDEIIADNFYIKRYLKKIHSLTSKVSVIEYGGDNVLLDSSRINEVEVKNPFKK